MEKYKNLSRNSGVTGYKIGPHYIIVQFEGGARYLYDDINPGRNHIAQMKQLAIAGKGLNSYIAKSVKKKYSQKLR